MRKRALFLWTLVFTLVLGAFAYGAEPPQVQAEAALLAEAGSGRVLYEKNSREQLYPASITKLVTALVALDYFSPQEVVVVGGEINDISLDSSKAGHIRGESITIENLLRGLIIPSGNDTANVLAVATARKANPDTTLTNAQAESLFVDMMNEKAAALGCTGSHFANAHGYHDPDHYTTAYDLYLIVKEALQNELIMEIAGETTFAGNGLTGTNIQDGSLTVQDYIWRSHNALILPGAYHYDYATGLKTGFTNEAGNCVAATAAKDGVSLIAIVLKGGDTERWVDAANLFDYGFENFAVHTVQQPGDVLGTVALAKHNRLKGDSLELVAKETLTAYLSADELARLQTELTFAPELLAEQGEEDAAPKLLAPLAEGQEVGTLTYLLDGEVWLTTPVYAKNAVEKQNLWTMFRYFVQNKLFTLKGGLIALAVVAIIVILVIVIKILIGKNRRRSRYTTSYRMPKHRRRRWK